MRKFLEAIGDIGSIDYSLATSEQNEENANANQSQLRMRWNKTY